jgi:hypothetical protein
MQVIRETPGTDPDILLITNYLAGELTNDAADAVEHRLGDDGVFFEKVWPLIRVWTSPLGIRLPSTHDAAVNEGAKNPVRVELHRRREFDT